MNRVVCVGSNFFGQLGIGSEERIRPAFCPVQFGGADEDRLVQDSIDIQCGSNFTAVLDENGQVHVCGSVNGTIMPRLLRAKLSYPIRCTQVACGRKHIVALGENGFVLSWGTGHFGQLGHGDDSNYDNPKLINSLEPRRIGSRVIRVACGGSHSGVVTNSGMVFMWGLNRAGQTGTSSKLDAVVDPQPIDTSDVHGGTMLATELVCGRNHSTLVTADGRLYSWGAATFGRLGLTDGRKKVMRPTEVKFFASRPVASLAVGDFHSLALCRNGELYSWGHNLEGQSGLGTAVNTKLPKHIDFFGPMFRAKEVACGASWSVVVSSSGRAYSWGHGDGGWLCQPSPVPPLMEADEIESCIPYVDSTPEDPVISSGLMNTRSFDSCHNVMLPRPIRIPFLGVDASDSAAPGEECVVEGVRCGGAHTLLYVSRVKRRMGAIPMRATVAMASAKEERVEIETSVTVDSRYECKSARSTTTTTSTTAIIAEGKDIGQRDPEDQCLSFAMIKVGGWTFTAGTGADETGYDLHSITTAASACFGVSTSPRARPSTRSTAQPPGIDTMDDDQLQSVLFSWCRHNKVPELTYALLNRGVFVDSRDGSGNTPLMVACQNGHLGLCQMLVEKARAGLDLKNNKGNTALHFCFAFGFHSVGEYLIAKGADEFATNVDGMTCYEGLCAEDLERF